MKCRICLSDAIFFDHGTILNKYKVAYFRCTHCGFIETEEPYWLDEAYSKAITRSDIGLVSRNLVLSKITKTFCTVFFKKGGKYIDYGGGYGLFVRLMRDAGFDFYYYDKHAENIFAKDFEADAKGADQYQMLTAFEVFEHIVNPVEEAKKMLTFSSNLLFTTELLPAHAPKPEAWWYYGLDHGQHVSFYTLKSLSVLAEHFRLNLFSDGRRLHLFSKKKFSSLTFKLLSRKHEISSLVRNLFGKDSLIPLDYKTITGKNLL